MLKLPIAIQNVILILATLNTIIVKMNRLDIVVHFNLIHSEVAL